MNDIIEAISCEREIIQLKLLNVPKHPKMIAKIFSILKDEEINVDMISQVTVDDFVQIFLILCQKYSHKCLHKKKSDTLYVKVFLRKLLDLFFTAEKEFLLLRPGLWIFRRLCRP